jgi:uncharacterized protein YuzE
VTMQLEFDLNVGALYIRLSDEAVAQTREAGGNAALDLDANGRIVGIEVISAAHQWPLEEILRTYAIPLSEAAQLRLYFKAQGISAAQHASPTISIVSPAARVLQPA